MQQTKGSRDLMVFIQEIACLKQDRAYVTNLDKCKSIGTHSIALHMNGNNITYFDSFGAEHVPKEIKKLINNQNITNIYRIQAHDSNVHIFLYWSY